MAKIIWTESALRDLDASPTISLSTSLKPARRLVRRVFERVEQLTIHPKKRVAVPRELRGSRYRQIVEPPCRAFYRYDGERVFILHGLRGERRLHPNHLRQRDRRARSV